MVQDLPLSLKTANDKLVGAWLPSDTIDRSVEDLLLVFDLNGLRVNHNDLSVFTTGDHQPALLVPFDRQRDRVDPGESYKPTDPGLPKSNCLVLTCTDQHPGSRIVTHW